MTANYNDVNTTAYRLEQAENRINNHRTEIDSLETNRQWHQNNTSEINGRLYKLESDVRLDLKFEIESLKSDVKFLKTMQVIFVGALFIYAMATMLKSIVSMWA